MGATKKHNDNNDQVQRQPMFSLGGNPLLNRIGNVVVFIWDE